MLLFLLVNREVQIGLAKQAGLVALDDKYYKNMNHSNLLVIKIH